MYYYYLIQNIDYEKILYNSNNFEMVVHEYLSHIIDLIKIFKHNNFNYNYSNFNYLYINKRTKEQFKLTPYNLNKYYLDLTDFTIKSTKKNKTIKIKSYENINFLNSIKILFTTTNTTNTINTVNKSNKVEYIPVYKRISNNQKSNINDNQDDEFNKLFNQDINLINLNQQQINDNKSLSIEEDNQTNEDNENTTNEDNNKDLMNITNYIDKLKILKEEENNNLNKIKENHTTEYDKYVDNYTKSYTYKKNLLKQKQELEERKKEYEYNKDLLERLITEHNIESVDELDEIVLIDSIRIILKTIYLMKENDLINKPDEFDNYIDLLYDENNKTEEPDFLNNLDKFNIPININDSSNNFNY